MINMVFKEYYFISIVLIKFSLKSTNFQLALDALSNYKRLPVQSLYLFHTL